MKKLSIKDGSYVLTEDELKELYIYIHDIGRQNGVLMEGVGIEDKVKENLEEFMEFQDGLKKGKSKKSLIDVCPFFYDTDFATIWKEFSDVRKKKKASQTDRSFHSLVSKVMEFSNGDKAIAIKIVEQSADSGWTDIYALKEQKNNFVTTQKKDTVTKYKDTYERLRANRCQSNTNPSGATDINGASGMVVETATEV